MNFKEAYKAMQEGKKVRRKEWKGYWFIEDDKVKIQLKDGNIKFNNFTQETIANTLAEDWEIVKEKKKYWMPKENERYYYIADFTKAIKIDVNNGWNTDNFRFSIGNCFENEEEADHMFEKLKVIHELQKFAYENNEREIDWNDGTQRKYFLIYDSDDNDIFIGNYIHAKINPFNICFTSEEIALKAIETIGADRIKKYYFDVEE